MWPKSQEIALVPGSSYKKKNNFTDCKSNMLENVHLFKKVSYTHLRNYLRELKSYFTIIILSQALH